MDLSEYVAALMRRARALPALAVLGFLWMLNIVAVPLLPLPEIHPPYFLMGVYYWSIVRPGLLPPWAVFAAGLTMDALGGLPLGFNAGPLVAAQWAIAQQRRFLAAQSHIMIWLGFVGLAALVLAVQWMLSGLAAGGAWPAPFPFFRDLLAGAALYPLVSVLLFFTHRLLLSRRAGSEPA